MRSLSTRLLLLVASLLSSSAPMAAQTCTGLCLQQTTCPGNATTSLTGVVYAPNGMDPLPHVMVYIPNAQVEPFPPGVSCPVAGATPSGSPLVGTITAVDGSFTLNNVPVGKDIPLVIVTGRWRRQLVIPAIAACTGNKLPETFAVMPRNQSEGDIPKIAVATGQDDAVECIMAQIGVDEAEVTDPGGQGRINLFAGGGAAGSGAVVDAATPTQASLMGDASVLNQYDVLMLPCEGADYAKPQQQLTNLVSFANAGGRVFTSHYSYSWMWTNPPFDTVAKWLGSAGFQIEPDEDPGTIDLNFAGGQTLAEWLTEVGAVKTAGDIPIVAPFRDTNGVNPPTQEYVYVTYPLYLGRIPPPIPIETATSEFVFKTPVAPAGTTVNQCGRILYNDFHVEIPTQPVNASTTYPDECPFEHVFGTSPQEQLLEYSLFQLTDDGGVPTIFPVLHDFGTEVVHTPSPPQVFTWTNNSAVPMTVASVQFTGTDFGLAAGTDGCTNQVVPPNASCTVSVVFTPTQVGERNGTLSIVSGVFSQIALLSGTGATPFSISPGVLEFGSVTVGDSVSLTATLTSNSTIAQPLPVLDITSGFTDSTVGCANPLPAQGTCLVAVTFSPTMLASQIGNQSGTLSVVGSPGQRVLLYGDGIPAFTLTPTSLDFGTVNVGNSATQTLMLQSFSTRALATPVFGITSNAFSASTSACGALMAPEASCLVSVTFTPPSGGTFDAVLADNSTDPVYAGLSATLTGNAGDFSFSLNPTSGSVVAGDGIQTTATLTGIAGLSGTFTFSCTSPAVGLTCSFSPSTTSADVVKQTVTFTTTSQYAIVGYTGGFGGERGLWLFALGSGCVLWKTRRRTRLRFHGSLTMLLVGTLAFSLTGCSGLLPAKNTAFTAPGTYAVNVTAANGALTHSATYTLTVTAK